MILGALVVPHSCAKSFEHYLTEIRKDTTVKPFRDDGTFREMKWSLVSKSNLEAYKRFVTAVFDFRIKHQLSSLKDISIRCLAVDTSAKPIKRTGEGDRETGFEKEFYFLCNVAVARRYRSQLFSLYLDRKYVRRRLRETRDILNYGAYKWGDKRNYPFRRLNFEDPEKCMALQAVDIYMGALASLLNRRHEALDANPAKKELADYIWKLCKLENPFVTSHHQRPRFMTWIHRPQNETSPRSGPQNIH